MDHASTIAAIHQAAANWTMQQMKKWGLQNIHLENGGHSVMGGRSRSSMGAGNACVRLADRLPSGMDTGHNGPLWGAEEGLYGSLAYVQQHFAARGTMKKTPEYDKLDVYSTMTRALASSVLYQRAGCAARRDLPVVDCSH